MNLWDIWGIQSNETLTFISKVCFVLSHTKEKALEVICSSRSRFHFKLHFNSVESILRKAHSHPFTARFQKWSNKALDRQCGPRVQLLLLFVPASVLLFFSTVHENNRVELCIESYLRRCYVGCCKSYTLDLGGSRTLYAHCFMWYQKVLLKSKTKHLIVLSKARLSDALRWSTKHFVRREKKKKRVLS